MKAQSFSVIIPVYNEADHIAANIREIQRTFEEFGCRYQIIAVDDGSQDASYAVLEKLCFEIPGLIVRKNFRNFGKGRALKKGFKYVDCEYVVCLDADLELHPYQVNILYDIMVLTDADVVIGSKMHPNSCVDYPLQRRIMSIGYYWFIRVLFGLPCHDTQTGLKLFKRKVLEEVFPKILVKKFAFDLEVLANAHHCGFKIAEAPIVLDPKRTFSRLGAHAAWVTAWDTLAVWYRMFILKYYDRIDYHRRKNLLRELKRVRR